MIISLHSPFRNVTVRRTNSEEVDDRVFQKQTVHMTITRVNGMSSY